MSKEKFKERLIHLFTKNIGLKLVSIFAAVLLWFVVINITDPVISSQIRNVPVTIINQDVISSSGKTLEILNKTDVVSNVIIKAPRSVMRELDGSVDTIRAVADMRFLSADETVVPISFSATKYSDKIETISPSSDKMEVKIEDKKTIQLPISATTSGEIEPGYIIGKVTQAQNQVRVSGPASIVSTISKASVDVQVTGFKETISTSADITLYDVEGNIIENKALELNVNDVRVEVEILETKKVPVKYSATGVPATGYGLTGEIKSDLNEVIIAGSSSAISRVSEIRIPEEKLTVTNLSSNLNAVIDIDDYLPNGLKLAYPEKEGTANVTVYIEPYQESTFNTLYRNIDIKNAPAGYDVEWGDDSGYVEFVVVGLKQDIEKIQMNQLNFALDFEDYEGKNSGIFKPGSYELPLKVDLPKGVELKETVKVEVILKK